MYAALAAARDGASVALVDRSLIGRGGATVMAQMTVSAALGEETPDSVEAHLADTLQAGRGLCDPALAQLLCEDGVDVIREMDDFGVGWARENGHIKQVQAPGHDRPRCVYVDFLNTGPAVSKTLRTVINREARIRRIGEVLITDILVEAGEVRGALGYHLISGKAVRFAAKAVIITTGGLTRLFRRNSASVNMGGDGYALALRAGAALTDMEFVQFFPIGHLAPRLIGMDPIMWDPFRYKLGGRLLNSEGREFTADYGASETGRYVATRDLATFAIIKEVEAGRGSPHSGAWLSFEHVPEAELRAAFGPVIERLQRNGIDLTRQAVEVAPIAHYHMGGVRVDSSLETAVSGLFAAGEAVGGANGANRLSGNAITEALAFGRKAGRIAAARARAVAAAPQPSIAAALDGLSRHGTAPGAPSHAASLVELQAVMAELVGPFRVAADLERALEKIEDLRGRLDDRPSGAIGPFDPERLDGFDLASMLLVAESVTRAALRRQESRGAHQRLDHPKTESRWDCHLDAVLDGSAIRFTERPVSARTLAA